MTNPFGSPTTLASNPFTSIYEQNDFGTVAILVVFIFGFADYVTVYVNIPCDWLCVLGLRTPFEPSIDVQSEEDSLHHEKGWLFR